MHPNVLFSTGSARSTPFMERFAGSTLNGRCAGGLFGSESGFGAFGGGVDVGLASGGGQ